MTLQERQIVAAEEVPPLDTNTPEPAKAEKAPIEITAIDPTWDVAQIATRGHVLVARAFAFSEAVFWPTLLLGIIAALMILQFVFYVFISMSNGPEGGVFYIFNMATKWALWIAEGAFAINVVWTCIQNRATVWIIPVALVGLFGLQGLSWLGRSVSVPYGVAGGLSQYLTFDPNTYFSLGGGLRGGPEVAWMGSYAPKPESLSTAEYAALVKAVSTDVRNHMADAKSWTAVADLQKKPTITRASKAITQYSDHLKDGIIIVPENGAVIEIAAHVEGQWSLTLVAPANCATVLGPTSADTGCQDQTGQGGAINGYAMRILDGLKPATKE